ncbi:MAG: amidase [Acidothermus sp.]|nr:amidase [Acidothermus sp.]MCL6537965.1 amidase [Acidothermus sp.]
MAELHDLSALEQADAVRRRDVSPSELVEHYLRRIEAWNERLGAYVTVTAELALREARRCEELLRTRDPERLPPLLGVPIAIKDLTDVAGVRGTLGSAVFADRVPSEDAYVVQLLRAAGTIILGKTNTPEFGLPCYTEPDVAPPARSPWNPRYSAGGSSGGSAVAVAAGLAPWAQGNDGGGSVRIPAAVCGLVGLKVTRGRVSNGPGPGDVSGLAWHGPLTRTVRDAAAWLDAVATPMPGDPYGAPPLPPGETFVAATQRDPGRLRIARFATPVIVEEEIDPECRAVYEAASTLLADLGHEIVDIAGPGGPPLVAAFEKVWAVLAASSPLPRGAEQRVRPLTRWLRERGRRISGPEYAAAIATLMLGTREVARAWEPYDAVLTPTLAYPAAEVGALRDDADPAADFENQKRFTPFTSLANMTGQPAITLPVGLSSTGLPVGVMLTGRFGDEATLLALAAQVESTAPWNAGRQPACWS